MDPAAISAALGLEAHIASRVGDLRTSRQGMPLGGHYPDTRWRHSVTHSVEHQWYANEVAEFVDHPWSINAFSATSDPRAATPL
jgi:hypothetical protein